MKQQNCNAFLSIKGKPKNKIDCIAWLLLNVFGCKFCETCREKPCKIKDGECCTDNIADYIREAVKEENATKPKTNFDRITENEESLAEHMVHLCYETYYDINRGEMDNRPYYTTITGECYYNKEEAIKRTIEWLQKEAEEETR